MPLLSLNSPSSISFELRGDCDIARSMAGVKTGRSSGELSELERESYEESEDIGEA
ncbi:hypothetical protein FS749_005108 [Ceratobasidium sp. UAMH 11750]|nr:hypothetical protein FS749_005108 [Ceratobasidium sp. UAMH 11750]